VIRSRITSPEVGGGTTAVFAGEDDGATTCAYDAGRRAAREKTKRQNLLTFSGIISPPSDVSFSVKVKRYCLGKAHS
jgi:hypothetical protein